VIHLTTAKRVILDTQVCSHAATGKIASVDWTDFCACLGRGFTHCISPLVVTELLYGLYGGNDPHFRRNQDKLRYLYQASKAFVFLPLPGQFLAKELFAIDRPLPSNVETDYELCVKLAIGAKDKQQILSGRLSPWGSDQQYTLDLAKLAKERDDYHLKYIAYLEGFRSRGFRFKDKSAWVAGALAHLGLLGTDENGRILLEGAHAWYCFEKFIFSSVSGNYNFKKHTSDLVDGQILQYLCDRNLILVTSDGPLRQRTVTSKQADRILTPAEFVARVSSV
jgi:hypothetical protein